MGDSAFTPQPTMVPVYKKTTGTTLRSEKEKSIKSYPNQECFQKIVLDYSKVDELQCNRFNVVSQIKKVVFDKYYGIFVSVLYYIIY